MSLKVGPYVPESDGRMFTNTWSGIPTNWDGTEIEFHSLCYELQNSV